MITRSRITRSRPVARRTRNTYSRTRYNPKEQVSIHNPYPARLWPYREGTKVYYISHRGQNPWIAKGRVRWYNPALESSSVLSKGDEIVTVNVLGGSDFGNAQVVSVTDTQPFTKKGLRLLLARIADHYRRRAASYLASADEETKKVAALERKLTRME